MMSAATPSFLPSSFVVDDVAGVLLAVDLAGGVPDPDERTICMALPLLALLPDVPGPDANFTGDIAPVVRTIPVVLPALAAPTGMFMITDGLDGCLKKVNGTVTSGCVPVTGNGPGCDCVICPVTVSRSCGIVPSPIACRSLSESEKVGQEMWVVLGLGSAGTDVTGLFGSGGVISGNDCCATDCCCGWVERCGIGDCGGIVARTVPGTGSGVGGLMGLLG